MALTRPTLTGGMLEVDRDLESTRETWQELAAESDNVFATWEWARAWWEHFGRGDPLVATARDEDGRAFAVVPLHVDDVPGVRMLRFVGHGAGDQLGPVCRPADTPRAASALRAALDTAPVSWDLFLGEQVPADMRFDQALDATVVARTGLPLIRRDGRDWHGFLASKSANFRQQVGRRERNLHRRHTVGYRRSDGGTLAADLDVLFDLHRRRWANERSLFLAQESFHRDFAAVASERGWLRLWLLELDGEPVAAWYGFRFGDAEYFYQAGRDPLHEGSPGFVLLCHTIREAFADGVAEYRLLRGAEDYKYRFASHDRGLDTVALGRTFSGNVALVAGRLARRARPVKNALKRPLDL